jgi:O-antigen ligase
MAYWSICIFSSHLLLFDKIILKKEIVYIYLNLFITALIILISGTRSAFLCLPFFFFIFLYFIRFFKINFFLMVFFFIFSIFATSFQEILTITIDRFLSTDYLSHLELRGYTRIIDYPQYLIFGSGQGLDERFYLTSDVINGQTIYFSFEIHSSFVAILFYYGIIGFILFILFLYRIFKNLNFIQRTAFILPFIYGLSTYGLRTPIFWFFIGVCVFVSLNNLKNKIS